MKGSRFVCLLCRHRLAISTPTSRTNSTRPTFRRTQTRLISRTVRRRDDRDNNTRPVAPGNSYNPVTRPETVTTATAPDSSRIRKIMPDRWNRPKVEWRKDLPKKGPGESHARADALFQQIVAGQRNPNEHTKPTAASTTLVQDIGKLLNMVGNGSPESAYLYLKTEIYPTIRQVDVAIPQIFSTVVKAVMNEVTTAKKGAMSNTKLPTVAEILRVWADIGMLSPQIWTELVGELVQTLVSMSISTEDYPSIEAYEKHLATRAAMVSDLVESLKLLSSPKFYDVPRSEHDGFRFPKIDEQSLSRFARTSNFTAAFCSMFPQYEFNPLGAQVAALTITTYALLRDRLRSNAHARLSATSFMSNVACLMTHVPIQDDALRNLMSSTFPSLEAYVMGEWPKMKREAIGGRFPQAGDPRSSPLPMLAYLLKQADDARNPTEVDRIWAEFIGPPTDLTETRVTLLKENVSLINSFINTYMALNQPDRALAVWGMLKRIGVIPDLKTWNAMLDGCKKARNGNGIRNVWAKMVSTGMELDLVVWTTRVSGLIESGDFEGGLHALEEMVRLWQESLKNPNFKGHVVEPTIEPVNAALTGLIRRKKIEAAERLLDWARRQGLKPDIFTFNTFLRPLIRDKRQRDVQRLFAQMKKLGVRADTATFTIVLDAALSQIEPPGSSLTDFEEAQKQTVALVLSQMEAAGLETNLQTYGKMVYLLLRSGGDRAKEAVKTVLAHLWAEGHELSPHIYTMLVEHYFSRRPPDLAAVDSLLRRKGLLVDGKRHSRSNSVSVGIGSGSSGSSSGSTSPISEMDRIFYDRVVRGYATAADDPTTALDLHGQLAARGYHITFGTEMQLLAALLRHNRAGDARAIATATRRRFEAWQGDASVARPGEADSSVSVFWKHTYWSFVEKYGLIEPETATPRPRTSAGEQGAEGGGSGA